MGRNKSKQARRAEKWAKRGRGINFDLSKNLLGGLLALAVSLAGLYQVIKNFRDDPQTFYFIIFPILAGVASLGLLIQAFRKKNPVFYAWLTVGMLLVTVALIGRKSYIETEKSKLVVVIAALDGPEEVYGLRNEIFENLNSTFQDDKEVKIIGIDEIVTSIEGRDKARNLGEQEYADIVIWGWYRPIENPNINIHIENLSPEQNFPILQESTTFQPKTTLAELDTSVFQQQAGQETSALISFLQGYVLAKSGNYNAALVRLDKALENIQEKTQILGNLSEIYIIRGMTHAGLEHREQAIEDFSKVIEIDPQHIGAYINRGNVYIHLGKNDLALQDFNKAIEIDPKFAASYLSRGTVYESTGQHDKAITEYNLAIELSTDSSITAVAYNERGHVYFNLGSFDQAISDCNMAIQLMPDYAEAYHNRGSNYDSLGQYNKAISDYNYAISLNPTSANTFAMRGDTYLHQERFDKAIEDYTKAIQLEPDYAYAYNNRGFTYAAQGQYDQAIIDTTYAIQLESDEPIAYFNRGTYYQKLGRVAEAEADFKKYEELTGQKP